MVGKTRSKTASADKNAWCGLLLYDTSMNSYQEGRKGMEWGGGKQKNKLENKKKKKWLGEKDIK